MTDPKSFRRANSRLGAAALDRSVSLDGNLSITFSRQQSKLQRLVSIVEDDASKLTADVLAWCKATPILEETLGNGPLTATPLSGGLCNDVMRVQGPSGQIIVKRAQAFVRAAENVPLAIERQATEAAALQLGYKCAPDTFPRFLFRDSGKHLLATEFLDGRSSLSEALQRGQVFPKMASATGKGLGRLAVASTPSALGPEATKIMSDTLAASITACNAMEEHVFYLPFDPAAEQNDWPDVLDDEVSRLVHRNKKLMAELAALRLIYKEPGSKKCVVHHDVWSGNVLCTPTSTHIIDFEFAGWGPAAYDIGHFIAHLVLCATVVRAYADIEAEDTGSVEEDVISAARRLEQQEWLLNSIEEAYDAFTAVLKEESEEELASLEDILGFSGIIMLRWTLGQFNLPENLGVERNSDVFVNATRRAVRVGSALLRDRRSIRSITKVTELARMELELDRPSLSKAGGWWCCGSALASK